MKRPSLAAVVFAAVFFMLALAGPKQVEYAAAIVILFAAAIWLGETWDRS